MLIAVFSLFLASLLAPVVRRSALRWSGWILALLPGALFCYFAFNIGSVAGGATFGVGYPWVPSLGVNLSFYLDGLSLLFALLICGIGALVLVYASAYLKGHLHLGRFYSFILLFMASMLGTVLADNLLTLFVFWELTSFSSYLLIGFEHGKETARKAALQALLVTGSGGLALLAGFLILGSIGGTLELSALLGQGELVRAHHLYLPALLLILAGAFTKSAQFPFHFWLPSAMEAPTPVSAYLHSATMVKAGIYLLARLNPVLGGTEPWQYILTVVGGITMLTGAVVAIVQTDLKRILAYSTVSTLGLLVMLLGLDTTEAIKAAAVYLLVHALYKGALFLAAGAVDHSAGTRNVLELGGLRRSMPIVAAAALLAALSMAGLPPLLGFIGKELLYEAKLQVPEASAFITAAGVSANILLVAVAAILCLGPFFGDEKETPREPHEAPASIWLGPLLLAGLGLILGLFPDLIDKPLIAPLVSAVRAEPTEVKLALWHGINPVLLLSIFTVAAGGCVYAARRYLYRAGERAGTLAGWGPARWYDLGLAGLLRTARLQTRILQSGYLRYYLMTVLGAAFLLLFYTLAAKAGLAEADWWPEAFFHEWVIAVMILAAAFFAATSGSRLAAVAAVGVVGYGVALIYILFGAPDLAMTQFCIETLSVILFVLVLYRLPRFSILSGRRARSRDVVTSLASGGIMTTLVLVANTESVHSGIGRFFAENALPKAYGRNVVNVILVDFRGLDTLGEITVLAVASLGVYMLLKKRSGKEGP